MIMITEQEQAPAEQAPLNDTGASVDAPGKGSELRRRGWALAGPGIDGTGLESLLGIVDTRLVAGLGTAAIAGVGSSLHSMFFVLAALAALSVGSSILVAQAVGARDLASAS